MTVDLASSSSVSKIMVTKGEPGTCSPLQRTWAPDKKIRSFSNSLISPLSGSHQVQSVHTCRGWCGPSGSPSASPPWTPPSAPWSAPSAGPHPHLSCRRWTYFGTWRMLRLWLWLINSQKCTLPAHRARHQVRRLEPFQDPEPRTLEAGKATQAHGALRTELSKCQMNV